MARVYQATQILVDINGMQWISLYVSQAPVLTILQFIEAHVDPDEIHCGFLCLFFFFTFLKDSKLILMDVDHSLHWCL